MGDVREGQTVKLFFKTEKGSQKELQCLVKQIYADRLILDFPDELQEYTEYLEEGNDLSVRIFTPLGITAFESLVLDSPSDSQMVIEYAEENAVDIQRREYSRIKYRAKLYIEKDDKTEIIAVTLEISGGGIMFYSKEKFTNYEHVNFILYMPEERSIRASGIILEKPYLAEHHHVVCFDKIDEKDRDRIIKKRFEQQIIEEREKQKQKYKMIWKK